MVLKHGVTKPASFDRDKALEEKFAEDIKAILGKVFITRDKIEDEKRGTDFFVFVIRNLRVAVRLRRWPPFKSWFENFTIRWSRPSGIATEIDKIREGMVDYLFYGHLNKDETEIAWWFVGDLKVFRENEPKPIKVFENKDAKRSQGAVFRILDLPSEFIVAKSEAGGLA